MKTRIIFLVLLIVNFSCGTNNKPVSDAQKEKIKGQVKTAVDAIFKGCEEATFDKAVEPILNSPEFVYTYNGNSFGYKQFVDAIKPVFATMTNQKVTITEEKYAIINNSTVVYSNNCKWLQNFKDGHSTLIEPDAMVYIFMKRDGKWLLINGIESYTEKVLTSESAKELNQVGLIKQFVGSWKCDITKDTTAFWDAKSYGTGIEDNYRFVTKGRIVLEGKGLYGYDKSIDKFIDAGLVKGKDIGIYALGFKSKSKYESIPYSDVSNPERASFKLMGEFKSPDMIVETTIINNKPIKIETWTRVK
jgi:hypothetical protein